MPPPLPQPAGASGIMCGGNEGQRGAIGWRVLQGIGPTAAMTAAVAERARQPQAPPPPPGPVTCSPGPWPPRYEGRVPCTATPCSAVRQRD